MNLEYPVGSPSPQSFAILVYTRSQSSSVVHHYVDRGLFFHTIVFPIGPLQISYIMETSTFHLASQVGLGAITFLVNYIYQRNAKVILDVLTRYVNDDLWMTHRIRTVLVDGWVQTCEIFIKKFFFFFSFIMTFRHSCSSDIEQSSPVCCEFFPRA